MHRKMKPFYQLIVLVISWLALSPCLSSQNETILSPLYYHKMKPFYYHKIKPFYNHRLKPFYHLTLGRNSSNHFKCIDSERDALLQFKQGVTADFCGLLTSWERHTDCCQWRGVVCSNLTSHVVKLGFAGYFDGLCYLEGKVSPSLGELKHLEHLDLSNNNFSGEIPHQLGNLSKLTTLDLSFAYSYSVDVQSLTWISRLTLLRYLDLSGTNLSKVRNWITIINNLPSLRVLSMDSCDLSQEIPSSISYVNSSATLQNVSLSSNFFKDGSILNWLFNFSRITTQLVHLDLSLNAFQVPIPSEFENFHSLSYLSLYGSGFQGSVSKIISKLCNLEELRLAKNNFNDELSNVIHSLVKCNNNALLVLDLSSNRFWGGISDDIGSLFSLRELYLGGNQNKGEINPGIGQLTMLEILDISSNSLEGTITHTLFLNLSNLRELNLADNPRLVIRIDEDWIPPFKLKEIQLRSCRLGPRFPKWLKFQTNFGYFDISNTGIFDSIPFSFWNSLPSEFASLNMSYNQIYGTLPNRLNISSAGAIDLSSNLFEGVVPSSFANTTWYLYLNNNRFSNCSNILCPNLENDLRKLDLSDNLFSGELSDCWMNFSGLISLHLENNEFSGRIPNSIGNLISLQILDLHNNSFSGQFPVAFENCTSLMILNLGYNLFSGNIPLWIGNAFQSLGALILRKNHFIGDIPESICKLNHLQILDLAINHFSGVIPKCFGNFTAMEGIKDSNLAFRVEVIALFDDDQYFESEGETATISWKREERKFKETIRFVKYIDLSGNGLRGEIPDEISLLKGLESLNLSKNKLSGKIPFEIGNLTALELLDLSNNHLTGEIPMSLAKVTYLGTLDVSNNNLSGQIPVSTQLQSFDASQYAGNPRLCGAPLPSCSKDRAPSNSNVQNGDSTSVQGKDHDFGFFLGLCISVVLGFIVGFWGVCGTLIIKTSWRHAYFRLLDNIKDMLF